VPPINGMHRGGRRRKLLAPVPKLDMKAGFWEVHSISLAPPRQEGLQRQLPYNKLATEPRRVSLFPAQRSLLPERRAAPRAGGSKPAPGKGSP